MDIDLIWGKWEQKYFSENQKKDSTALSTNRPTGKSSRSAGDARTGDPMNISKRHDKRRNVALGPKADFTRMSAFGAQKRTLATVR